MGGGVSNSVGGWWLVAVGGIQETGGAWVWFIWWCRVVGGGFGWWVVDLGAHEGCGAWVCFRVVYGGLWWFMVVWGGGMVVPWCGYSLLNIKIWV